MGFFSLQSGSVHGMQAHPVQIEVDISFGLPRFSIVGLPDAAVQESKERIRSALQNNGFSFPKTVITVNLAPAHERKQGSHHDASIAIGLLAAEGLIKTDLVKKIFIAAELGLSGELRPVRGIIPLALMAKHLGYEHIMTSPEDANIVKEIPDLSAHGCENLQTLITHLAAPKLPEKIPAKNGGGALQPTSQREDGHPFKNIRGLHLAKRALIIAISGNHPLLLIGPPGSGKTLLAKSAQHLLPPLSFKEALELACINSVQKERASEIFSYRRPFRSPHHHTSPPALIGGGSPIVPGEISLAHHGILFLDELPEFPKQSLEALREPLEAREVHIARAKDHATFPAATQLICAMNPCPCGYFGDPERTCSCDKRRVQNYQERLSGPLLDRIDLFVDLHRIPAKELFHEDEGNEEKYPDKEIIARTRKKQWERFAISGNNLAKYEKLAHLTQETKNLFCKAGDRLRLSGRGYTKLLRISRTIADLAQSEEILAAHASEALSYRSRLLTKN